MRNPYVIKGNEGMLEILAKSLLPGWKISASVQMVKKEEPAIPELVRRSPLMAYVREIPAEIATLWALGGLGLITYEAIKYFS